MICHTFHQFNSCAETRDQCSGEANPNVGLESIVMLLLAVAVSLNARVWKVSLVVVGALVFVPN